MKIAFILTRYDSVGGAQIHVRDLASALRLHGHEATVLVGQQGPVAEALQSHTPLEPVPHLIRSIRPSADAQAFQEIRSILKRLRPDVVSTHSSKAGWLGRLAARSLGIPVIFTAHGWSFTDGVPALTARVYIGVERMTSGFADKIITVSEFDRTLALKHQVATEDKIVAVHNGMPDVDPNLSADPAQQPCHLVMVARFFAQKDHETLFRALSEILMHTWTLDLIGDGPLQAQAEARAAELGLSDRVRFLGSRSDVAEQLAEASLFLLITKWEGFPRSILEAMRAGLPVIASDVGGVSEAVTDGVTGCLVGRGDVAAVREALTKLIKSPELRQELGREGRRRYETDFTFQAMFEKNLGIYKSLVNSKRRKN